MADMAPSACGPALQGPLWSRSSPEQRDSHCVNAHNGAPTPEPVASCTTAVPTRALLRARALLDPHLEPDLVLVHLLVRFNAWSREVLRVERRSA